MNMNVLTNNTGIKVNNDTTDKPINTTLDKTRLNITSNKINPLYIFDFIYPFTAPAAMLSTRYLENMIKMITIGKMEMNNPIYNGP